MSAVTTKETTYRKKGSHWTLLLLKKLPTKTVPTERCYRQKKSTHKNSSHWALLSPKKLPTKTVPTEHCYRQRNCPQNSSYWALLPPKKLYTKTVPTERCYRQRLPTKQFLLSAVTAKETAHKNSSHWALLSPKKLPTKNSYWALLSPKKLPTKTVPTERCYRQRNCPQKQFPLSTVIAKETAHRKKRVSIERCYR